ncbi:nudix hydrolase 20, chloroplastic-like isoform X2 [Diospyros lotus]|uniref:nudix hydrolase 20, chloroplastic-like isoform X2 n=1 Tax=Diospyros lotus TaxID=55363 RepID=UPI002253B4F9|nr:nudix hydrolase 20, chloroplastic-like isoform X2 [Diospyros lotus]
MACNPGCISHKFRTSRIRAPFSHPILPKRPLNFVFHVLSRNSANISRTAAVSGSGFTWDDVFEVARSENRSSDLDGFFNKIKLCNRGSDKQTKFIPFVTEDQTVGYVHNGFADHLRRFQDVFIFPTNNSYNNHFGNHVTLHPALRTHEEKTRAVADVVKCLGEEIIPGIRNELYPVTSSFGIPAFFSLERAAAPYFGIKAYGVHMNGYVERAGQKYLWIGKRSEVKPTYPGMLDHLVAGGLPHGIACGKNLVKECEEEAGISSSISNKAIPVGAVSYVDIDGYRYKRDVLFCYDLRLPEDFIPNNKVLVPILSATMNCKAPCIVISFCTW